MRWVCTYSSAKPCDKIIHSAVQFGKATSEFPNVGDPSRHHQQQQSLHLYTN